ncbi:centrosomal protein of 89 kDa isoform X2 [Patella vulgata]|uniref:centrosomal protein of 89 kDa isoform X2 n=1 Tax=Patella vulgata TaxID=6465 RepID=UPI0021805A6C|nr:centrosomal protein of 89 kDa isoform X2 [Patella vulgata]
MIIKTNSDIGFKMAASRRRAKSLDTGAHRHISPALIPAVAFAAVPKTGVEPPDNPWGMQRDINMTLTGTGTLPRLFASRRPMSDDDLFSDPESSLYDYQQMDEAGYSTVEFGTWPRRGGPRPRPSNQSPKSQRSFNQQAASTAPGFYHIIEPNNNDIYAVPDKPKFRKSQIISSENDFQDNNTSLKTTLGVMDAMEAVQNLPQEETVIQESSRKNRGSGRKSRSGHRSDRSTTHHSRHDKETVLIKDKTLHISMENERLQQENIEMQKELGTLRDVATAISEGDLERAASLGFQQKVDELKEENEHLKSSVHRVNQELSQYQAHYRPLTEKQKMKLQGLPSNGPVPSWLISKKYLAPLFLAYDDELNAKDEHIHKYQMELDILKQRAVEIAKENKNLRIQGGYGNEIGPIDSTEWQQLQEQARLVLEENQILMEQIEVLQSKSKDMYNAHLNEVTRLTKKLTSTEADKIESERNMEELKIKLREAKHKNDILMMSAETQVSVQDHVTTIANLKRSINEDKEIHERESESLTNKLKASEAEQKCLARQVADVTAENRQLHAQVKMLERTYSKAQQKLAVFHKAVEQSENKEMITQEQLANLIKVAELTALERDTYAKAAKEQEKESKQTLNKMLERSVTVGKLEERLKLYKMKAASKLSTVAERLKEQDESFQRQRQEYEREIKYLRLVISEKEQLLGSVINEKKSVEDDLENMWQAANSENMRLKDTIRKTRKPGQIDDIEDDELLTLPADKDNRLDE